MSLFPPPLVEDAARVLESCRRTSRTLATAESCSGGLIGALLTEIPGASDVFTHGFITYANAAKHGMLDVSNALIAQHGAVSAEVALAMAEGALHAAQTHIAVSVTGVAGPGGATATKPVGLVYIAVAQRAKPAVSCAHHFSGDRSAIRLQAVKAALDMLHQQLC